MNVVGMRVPRKIRIIVQMTICLKFFLTYLTGSMDLGMGKHFSTTQNIIAHFRPMIAAPCVSFKTSVQSRSQRQRRRKVNCDAFILMCDRVNSLNCYPLQFQLIHSHYPGLMPAIQHYPRRALDSYQPYFFCIYHSTCQEILIALNRHLNPENWDRID